MANTAHHLETLSKSVNVNKSRFNEAASEYVIESKFREVEDEWAARKEEMLRARSDISMREQERIRKLVDNVEIVGMKENFNETDLGNFISKGVAKSNPGNNKEGGDSTSAADFVHRKLQFKNFKN